MGSLTFVLKHIEDALVHAKPETTNRAMIETVEYFRKYRIEAKAHNLKFGPLLEEVIVGQKTFAGEMERLGPHKFLGENLYLFGGNVFLNEEIKYLDVKLAELYHAKK